MTAAPDAAERVLSFWIGPLDADGLASPEYSRRWYTKDPAFDAEIREKFEADRFALDEGLRLDWLATPRGRLAAIIVLDQFSRNMYRGTADMFSTDALALRIAEEGITAGADRGLAASERSFFYMPFMHSEDLAMQARSVALFTGWRDGTEGRARASAENALGYAIKHRDLVVKWGRFPHRTLILGRTASKEELEFLKQPGSGF